MNRRWYAWARGAQGLQYNAVSGIARRPARSTLYALSRIATLPRVMGERLDELRPPYRVWLFVAYAEGGPGVPAELVRQTRFHAVLHFQSQTDHWPRDSELKDLRKRVDAQLGLQRRAREERGEPDGGANTERSAAVEECPPTLGLADLEAAFGGTRPELLRQIEQFVQLRRQTA